MCAPDEVARPTTVSKNPRGYDRTAWLILTGILLSLSIASRAGMIAWPFLNDAGLYAYLGKTVAEGGVMYRDFYETKLPGVGLIASAFWRAFAPAGQDMS